MLAIKALDESAKCVHRENRTAWNAIVLVFLMLTLTIFYSLIWCFCRSFGHASPARFSLLDYLHFGNFQQLMSPRKTLLKNAMLRTYHNKTLLLNIINIQDRYYLKRALIDCILGKWPVSLYFVFWKKHLAINLIKKCKHFFIRFKRHFG